MLKSGDKDAVATMGLRKRHQTQPELEDNETPLIDDGRAVPVHVRAGSDETVHLGVLRV